MPNNKIYLNNLDSTVTESLLKAHFARYGEISEIHLPVDKKRGTPKGYAFITFSEEAAAQQARQENGKPFLDKPLTVEIAIEKRRKQ